MEDEDEVSWIVGSSGGISQTYYSKADPVQEIVPFALGDSDYV